MKRLLYALLAACGITTVPILLLRLQSDSRLVTTLKSVSSNLLLPGTFLGFVGSGGKIDDISFVFADSINFILYFVLIYLLLVARNRYGANH